MTIQNLDDRYAQTRLLLALWYLGGLEKSVKKSELTEWVKRGKEKAGDYTTYLETLVGQGSIALTDLQGNSLEKIPQKGTAMMLLTASGKAALGVGLADAGFQFATNVGCKVPNALLKWIREGGSGVVGGTGEAIAPKISTYEEFKAVALEVYDQLNRDYNYDKLVPIYKIRRAIGDRVTRSQFDEWLLEAQANEVFQFITGGVADLTPDKEKDSITTELGGLRYYAKLL
ncbi:MAG: hypothetical protein HC916_11545 [Coleofasciculaceae cyanobacterium SM2_1_6]|nr:hypothetical protein [Coleofasciculaceae cyanobacterium SM2_1_6]